MTSHRLVAIAAASALALTGCPGEENPSSADAGFCPAREILEGRTLAGEGTFHDYSGLNEAETWRAEDSPHIVSNFGLTVSGELTIEPCAVIVVPDERGITVQSFNDKPAKLLAQGTADRPIVFTGKTAATGRWNGLLVDNPQSELNLAHATVQYAGYAPGDGKEGASIRAVKAKPVLDHVTVRHGGGTGIVLQREAEFGPGSGALTITKSALFPIETCQVGARSIPAGSYTENGDNRFLVKAYGAGVPNTVGPVTWPNRGLPYLYDVGSYQGWSVPWTLEAGLHVYVKTHGVESGGLIVLDDKGALIADGKSEAGRIVIEGEGGANWAGITFARDIYNDPSHHAAPSTLNYVTIKGAGFIPLSGSAPICKSLAEVMYAAIRLQLDCLTMTNTIIEGTGPKTYGVARDYCGSGAQQFSLSSTGNVFKGPLACAESDQQDCEPPACTAGFSCCNHNLACHGTVQ